jgi:putative membrane protein
MPKPFFNPTFQTQLEDAIIDFENRCNVELVVVVKDRSDDYKDIELWVAILAATIALFIFFFTPPIYGDFLILTGYGLAFLLGLLAFRLFPKLKRPFISKKRRTRSAEIAARAIFQKAGLYKTAQHTGLLVYISLLEQQVTMIADFGIEKHLSTEELHQLKDAFQSIFKSNPADDSLIKVISDSIAVFEQRIPVLENNESELPNTLHIDADFSL